MAKSKKKLSSFRSRFGRRKPSGRSNGNGNGNGGGKEDFAGIVQGVGRVPTRAFGRASRGDPFCAYDPSHLPLPRAIGNYTVIRTTQMISTTPPGGATRGMFIFGRFRAERVTGADAIASEAHVWTPYCMVAPNALANPVNDTTNCHVYSDQSSGDLSGLGTMVPSAFSVQVMNPESLQSTNGIVYIGRFHTQVPLSNSDRTWSELASQFVSYNAPRLCAAGKLALRGVTVDAVPFNMSALSDFTQIAPIKTPGPSFLTTWNGSAADYDTNQDFSGFAPIVVYNPDSIELSFLVTTEWRMRFDPSNPAQASHTYHGVASDNTWAGHINRMTKAGHGVLDIAERVAKIGAAVAPIVTTLAAAA